MGAERSATIAIVNTINGVHLAFCAGVWVGETEVVTAAHCIDGGKPGEHVSFAQFEDVQRPEYTITEAHTLKVLRIDGAHDLMLLGTSFPPPHPHAVARIAPHVRDGEPVAIVGHPGGLLYTWMAGAVSRAPTTLTPSGVSLMLQVTVPAARGSSGGGAFNAAGEVVGIASYNDHVPWQTFFVHRATVAALVEAGAGERSATSSVVVDED